MFAARGGQCCLHWATQSPWAAWHDSEINVSAKAVAAASQGGRAWLPWSNRDDPKRTLRQPTLTFGPRTAKNKESGRTRFALLSSCRDGQLPSCCSNSL